MRTGPHSTEEAKVRVLVSQKYNQAENRISLMGFFLIEVALF